MTTTLPFAALDAVLRREAELFECCLAGAPVVPVDERHARFEILAGPLRVHVRWNPGVELQVRQRVRRTRFDHDGVLPPEDRAEALSLALSWPNTVARLFPLPRGEVQLYGLVNPKHFRSTEKPVVRAAFHDALRAAGVPVAWPAFGRRRDGAPTESYALPGGDGTTECRVQLKYGLDNGCSSYRLSLADVRVVICSNGLVLRWLTSCQELRWHHTRSEPVTAFLDRGFELLLGLRSELERSIHAAAEEPAPHPLDLAAAALPEATPPELRARILTAVSERAAVERGRHGPTRWAASQTLTWVGTHVVSGLDGWRLREAGTRVLGVG